MIFRKLIISFLPIIDYLLLIPIIVCYPFYFLFVRIGGRRLPKSRNFLKNSGFYPIRNHYYQPLFDHRQLTKPLDLPRDLPGIDFNIEKQIQLLQNLNFSRELIDMKLLEEKDNDLDFSLFNNTFFGKGDAEYLYQLIRQFKPKNVYEIGSGFSTKIASKALKRNNLETGIMSTHVCIEPYEVPWLENLEVKVFRELLQNLDKSIFSDLGQNDFLFIDSSHIIRPQGDVLTEYLEIIPKLNSGVIIHVHDIFTPRDYLESWIKEDVLFWNEQYLLEALLTNSNRYEIIAALNYLHHLCFDDLKKICPYLEKSDEPGSFYFRVK